MANLWCKNANLTEEMVDAIAIFEWYLETLHQKYYGEYRGHALSGYRLYYQCVDEAVILHIVTTLTKNDKYYQEHPKTREEELDDYRAYVCYLTERVEEFMRIAADCTDVEKLLELCDHQKKTWNTSKYGGGQRLLAEQIDWSIFQPDYAGITVRITVRIETEEEARTNKKMQDWNLPALIQMSCDLTDRVRELLGDVVCRAAGEVDYYNYIDAKIYLDHWKTDAILQVGEAEYLENLRVEFVNGRTLEFGSSEWGWVSFRE